VLNTGADSVSAISAKTLKVSKVIAVGAAPVAIATDLGLGMSMSRTQATDRQRH